MRSLTFLAAFRDSIGGLVAVGTDGRRNVIADAESWAEIASWRGRRVTAACAVMDGIVCAALDGAVYVVTSQGVETLQHEERTACFWAGASWGPSEALFGGNTGRLLRVDASSGKLALTGLGAFGIARPGRTILAISDTSPRLLGGQKELLLAYEGTQWSPVIPPSKRETACLGAVIHQGTTWVSARSGARPVLLEIAPAESAPKYHALPFAGPRGATISLHLGSLLLVSDRILFGWPGRFVEIELPGRNDVIATFPDEATGAVLLVSYTGRSTRISLSEVGTSRP